MKIGDVVQKVALARWSRTFAGTVSSGVPILQAIQISGQTAGNAVIAAGDGRRLRLGQEGRLDRQAARGARRCSRRWSRRWSRSARSPDSWSTMLEKIADFYDAEVDAKVKALTSLIEPVMIIVVGVDGRLHRDLDVPADLQALRQHQVARASAAYASGR